MNRKRSDRKVRFNLLKPTGYVMHQQTYHSIIVLPAHTVYICVFISELSFNNCNFCPHCIHICIYLRVIIQ